VRSPRLHHGGVLRDTRSKRGVNLRQRGQSCTIRQGVCKRRGRKTEVMERVTSWSVFFFLFFYIFLFLYDVFIVYGTRTHMQH